MIWKGDGDGKRDKVAAVSMKKKHYQDFWIRDPPMTGESGYLQGEILSLLGKRQR